MSGRMFLFMIVLRVDQHFGLSMSFWSLRIGLLQPLFYHSFEFKGSRVCDPVHITIFGTGRDLLGHRRWMRHLLWQSCPHTSKLKLVFRTSGLGYRKRKNNETFISGNSNNSLRFWLNYSKFGFKCYTWVT